MGQCCNCPPTINIVLLSCKNTSCASHKSLKMTSVFVGNIPYGVTEDQLKDIFGEAGSVVSFRIVHDRETGRSKGFGFYEYQDPSSAQHAMRDLNGYELNGRTLRVDTANRR